MLACLHSLPRQAAVPVMYASNCACVRRLVQVVNKEFELLTHLARCSACGKRDAFLALNGLVDKIHELKHKWVGCMLWAGHARCICWCARAARCTAADASGRAGTVRHNLYGCTHLACRSCRCWILAGCKCARL